MKRETEGVQITNDALMHMDVEAIENIILARYSERANLNGDRLEARKLRQQAARIDAYRHAREKELVREIETLEEMLAYKRQEQAGVIPFHRREVMERDGARKAKRHA